LPVTPQFFPRTEKINAEDFEWPGKPEQAKRLEGILDKMDQVQVSSQSVPQVVEVRKSEIDFDQKILESEWKKGSKEGMLALRDLLVGNVDAKASLKEGGVGVEDAKKRQETRKWAARKFLSSEGIYSSEGLKKKIGVENYKYLEKELQTVGIKPEDLFLPKVLLATTSLPDPSKPPTRPPPKAPVEED
jgi:hypothetical protein